MLDDDQLIQLYRKSFQPYEGWPTWMSNYEAVLRRFEQLPDDELRSPAIQEELWRARVITSIGPGDSIDVTGTWTDQDIVEGVVALRSRSWPTDAPTRANAIQAEYDRLLEWTLTRGHARVRPQAKLARLFAALLPEEMHCVFQYKANRNLRDLLLGGKAGEGPAAEHVLIRARMRSALGKEESLAEHVRRSVFCWWLHEQHDALTSKTELPLSVPAGDVEPGPLSLWSFNKMYKGLGAVARTSAAYRDVVREARAGVTRQELIEILGEDPNFNLAVNSRGVLISSLKSVGLLENRGELMYPTEAGEEFLESDVPNALVELLLVRYFPFAHLLRILYEQPLSTSALYEKLLASYPLKTNQMPSQALVWVRDLGLVETRDGANSLTGYGEAWHSRIPAELPSPPAKEETSDGSSTPEEESDAATVGKAPSLEMMLRLFREDPEATKLFFSDTQIATLHAAWHSLSGKHFVILSGLSGTGKTRIVETYARLYLEAMGLSHKEHAALVAVSPDWRDPTGLLGYSNPLREAFDRTPALELLLRADDQRDLPFFLILDEMNLASVERYFAPFLSAMESQRPLDLHSDRTEVNGVPRSIDWPKKLFIAGTINMDETTHTLSDKVLDRAFTLEFWDVDLEGHFARRGQHDPEVEKLLLDLQASLQPVRRHFGYRTANEVLAFVAAADTARRTEMIDQAILSKVLPRLRGEDGPQLRKALQDAASICEKAELPRSAGKLQVMKAQLEATGLTRFWS